MSVLKTNKQTTKFHLKFIHSFIPFFLAGDFWFLIFFFLCCLSASVMIHNSCTVVDRQKKKKVKKTWYVKKKFQIFSIFFTKKTSETHQTKTDRIKYQVTSNHRKIMTNIHTLLTSYLTDKLIALHKLKRMSKIFFTYFEDI